MSDSAVLILGGCGFIGRHLVHYLCSEPFFDFKIIIADKSPPALVNLSPEIKESFDRKEKVTFIQADLSRDDHVKKVFNEEFGITHVLNLCGETRFGLPESEYERKCVQTALKCGKAAKELNIKLWIEVSTAQVYPPSKKPSNEDDKLEPWTRQAKFRLQAEELLRELELPLVIFRPAMVYGHGDLTSLTPRIATAAVYQYLDEKMKNLWSADLRIDVVHVEDVCKALWYALQMPSGTIFNLVDESELTQGKLNEMLGEIFRIKTGFMGTIVSKMAETVGLKKIVDHANDKHVPAWQRLCQENNILNTPISPYIDQELLYNKHLSVDGSRIAIGLKHPKLDVRLLKKVIFEFQEQGLFPRFGTSGLY